MKSQLLRDEAEAKWSEERLPKAAQKGEAQRNQLSFKWGDFLERGPVGRASRLAAVGFSIRRRDARATGLARERLSKNKWRDGRRAVPSLWRSRPYLERRFQRLKFGTTRRSSLQ